MFKVYQERCKNCLFSKEALVNPERIKEIIKTCLEEKTHFVCHKSTMQDDQGICCRGFYDIHGDEVDKIQVFKRLNLVEFIAFTENEKLPSYKDLKEK